MGNDELKSHYRKLVAENHPDKLMARRLPKEFIAIATDHQRGLWPDRQGAGDLTLRFFSLVRSSAMSGHLSDVTCGRVMTQSEHMASDYGPRSLGVLWPMKQPRPGQN